MDQPRSELSATPSPPPTAYRPPRAVHGAETVINPERRGAPLPLPEGPGLPTPSVWLRLFPSEVDYQDPANVPSPAGLQLGHFELQERIGAGGMGAVFRAMDVRLQRAVAVKILSPSLSRDEAAVQRFRNEARAAARLDHENIARVYFIGEELGLHFIAFEFITGDNLRTLIRDHGRIKPNEAVNYVLQIASALRHTSANGVVHRDIKPSNIIITPSGRAKLVDLGLARKESVESTQDLTLAGTTLGTFDYLSPEQAKDPRNVDVRSDIYSLGCTLYHMLTGEPPYPEGTVLKKLLDHQSGEPPDPAKKNRRVPADLSLVCRKMMASDPKKRYQTPDQLIHDLMLVAGALGLRGVSPEGLVWMTARRSISDLWRQNVGVIAMVTLLVAIVVGIGRIPQLGEPWGKEPVSHAAMNSRTGIDGQTSQATGSSVVTNGPKTIRFESVDQPSSHASAADKKNAGQPSGQNNVESSLPAMSRNLTNSGRNSSFSPMPLLPDLLKGTSDDLQTRPFSSEVIRPESVLFPPITQTPTTVRPRANGEAEIASASGTTKSNSNMTTTAESAASVNDKPPPATVDEPLGVFVLASDGSAAKRFPTLEAACAAVSDGSVIELRYNGRRSEKPIRVSKKNITIRAGRGFHPVVEFSLGGVAAESQIRLIGVSSGPVQVRNVGFEITVPTFFAVDRISLFSVDRSEQLRLQGVSITLTNPGQRPAALFDLSTEPGQMLADMKMSSTGVARDPLEIELTECFVRGHGDLFLVRSTKPGRLALRDSAFVLSGSILKVEGHSEKSAEQTRLEFRMEHVTGLYGQSLVRLDSGDVPRELPPVAVNARNCILSASGAGALVTVSGNTSDADFRKLLLWSGEKNFYDKTQVFWSFASGAESLGFEEWKGIWGTTGDVAASNDPIGWTLPSSDFAIASLKSLSLDRTELAASPARNAATDGSHAGADVARLPQSDFTESPPQP